MEKLDLTKKHKTYFTAKTRPEIVDIEPAHFLSLTGKGDPSSTGFAENIQALYATAYTLKFMCKALDKDFVVSKLQCQWWYDVATYGKPTMAEAPKLIPRSEWEYRLLLRLPDYVTEKEMKQAAATAYAKKQWPLINAIEWFELTEGKCVQMLHVGPFSKEPETLQQMLTFINEHGFAKNGEHHEIYLSDFNKTAPEKLKTILREPVK